MKTLLTRTLPLLALALLGGGQARAEFVDYSYHWSIAPSSVIPSGTGSALFALAGDGTASSEVGSATPTKVPGATVTTTSSATTTPDTFSTTYGLTLQLTDSASGQSGNLTFSGTLSGTLTATSSALVASFSSPLTQQLDLGGHLYSVTIDPSLLNLPAPMAGTPAAINALVSVSNGTNPPPPPPTQTPEPSGLVLGATALLAGLYARRRARRKAAAV
jgi:hypothetical protein